VFIETRRLELESKVANALGKKALRIFDRVQDRHEADRNIARERNVYVRKTEPTMSCHDVSNNADGKDSRLADQTGVTNNLSLDPAYCDLALHLHLAMTSPCAAATLSP